MPTTYVKERRSGFKGIVAKNWDGYEMTYCQSKTKTIGKGTYIEMVQHEDCAVLNHHFRQSMCSNEHGRYTGCYTWYKVEGFLLEGKYMTIEQATQYAVDALGEYDGMRYLNSLPGYLK